MEPDGLAVANQSVSIFTSGEDITHQYLNTCIVRAGVFPDTTNNNNVSNFSYLVYGIPFPVYLADCQPATVGCAGSTNKSTSVDNRVTFIVYACGSL